MTEVRAVLFVRWRPLDGFRYAMKTHCLVFLLFTQCYCATEIWSPAGFREMIQNKTQMIGEYIKTQTTNVGDVISSYVDEAQKQTREMKRDLSEFIDEKADTVSEYIERAKNVSSDWMNNVSVFKGEFSKDPDVELTTPQMVARHGYPVESHFVQTEDGYLLTLHRIPRGKNAKKQYLKRQPILLHHGLLASSSDWIISGPQKALAYLLADSGYDVWMANARGNTYSRAHIHLTSDDKAFWDFSWHEVGVYDLPAYIDYINELTESKDELIYIGHSMGTTVLFVLLSSRPEYNYKLKAGFTLAPVTYMSSIKSPIRLLAPFANDIETISKFLGSGEFLPQSFVLKWLARFGCEFNHIEQKICENSIFIMCGFDEQQFNSSLLPVILSHTPAGASTKSLVHYAQEIYAKGRFQRFDYGPEKNSKTYGTKIPPEYNISKIDLPIALFSSYNDWLSGIPDARSLFKKLPNPIEMYEVPLKDFNHLDFLWGIDAPTLVYRKLFELLNNYKTDKVFQWSFSSNGIKLSFS